MAERQVKAKLSWDGVKGFVQEITGAGKATEESFERAGKTIRKSQDELGKFTAKAKESHGPILGIRNAWSALAALGVTRFLRENHEAIAAEQQSVARLESALKNVRTAREGDVQALIEQAGALQKVTTFSDEQIISAQAMLATFQLNGDQISELIPRVLDMAAAMEKSGGESANLEQIAIALGKAMTGQVGLLSRYGVVIDENAIKTDKWNGILKSVDDSFKGIAEGSGKTQIGQLKIMANVAGSVSEEFGKLQLKVLSLADALAVPTVIEAFSKLIGDAAKGAKLMRLSFFGTKEELKAYQEELDKLLDKSGQEIPKMPIVEQFTTLQEEALPAMEELIDMTEHYLAISDQIPENQMLITDETERWLESTTLVNETYLRTNEAIASAVRQTSSLEEAAALLGISVEEVQNQFEGIKAAEQDAGKPMAMLVDFGKGLYTTLLQSALAGEKLSKILSKIIKQLLTRGLFGLITGAIGGLLGGPGGFAAGFSFGFKGFQHGGRFERGRLALVGERGPELVAFDRPGQVVPSPETGRIIQQMGERNLNVSFNVVQQVTDLTDDFELLKVASRLNRLVRQGELTLLSSGVV